VIDLLNELIPTRVLLFTKRTGDAGKQNYFSNVALVKMNFYAFAA